ncbi:phage major tail tube protein [Lysinibacillus sp. FSL K6-0075]|uniref:phage major tail tube protein n=1 Tax=Lysinibacillus sp. FSL K6-0075 TaxID=2921415 RepID=UPI0031598B22
MFPEKINDFRVFANDKPDLLGITDAEFPELKYMAETVNGAGILGEYEAPNYGHLESMKLKLNWRVITNELVDFYKPDSIKIDLRMANQIYDIKNRKREITPSRVLIHGSVLGNPMGKVAKGSPYEASTEVEVYYIKLEYDGKVMLEYDRHNYIYKVDGIDYSAKIREALGI